MSYTKKMIKQRAVSKVSFHVSAEECAGNEAVYLVGSFNDWSPVSLPMKKRKDGSFTVDIELPLGQKYFFRYLGADGVWFNDREAEDYEPCGFCEENNCVIQL